MHKKTVLITGASRGIGLATAQKFISEGWQVIGTSVRNSIPIHSPNLFPIRLDQGSPASISSAAAKITRAHKTLDVLVNNAGIILDAKDTLADVKKIRRTFEVDVVGLIDLTEHLLPLMRPGSHVINLDSQYGSFSFPIDDKTATGYRLAKAALNMYTRTLAFRLKDKKITVSSLDPGWVKTDMGFAVSTETEKPVREPSEPAGYIFKLATTKVTSGCFWRLGHKRAW